MSRGVVFGTFSSCMTSLLYEPSLTFDLDRLVGLLNVLILSTVCFGVGELGWLFFMVFTPNVMPAWPRSRSGPLLPVSWNAMRSECGYSNCACDIYCREKAKSSACLFSEATCSLLSSLNRMC